MPLPPEFVADCPYGPGGILLDDITRIDRETSTIVATMPTHPDMPITREQRAHPERHPAHVSGGLIIHVTGILGFAHAYFLHDIRHADGWIGYGTHIHDARFKKLGRIGPPITMQCMQTMKRMIKGAIIGRYKFRFEQDGGLIYEGDQSALFTRVT
ncbi:MAG: hypothetical protein ABI867_35345 [Kofleriaceae bacterium]